MSPSRRLGKVQVRNDVRWRVCTGMCGAALFLTTKEHKERWDGLYRNTKVGSPEWRAATGDYLGRAILTTKEHKERRDRMDRNTKVASRHGRLSWPHDFNHKETQRTFERVV